MTMGWPNLVVWSPGERLWKARRASVVTEWKYEKKKTQSWEYNWLVVWNMAFIFPYIGNVIIPTDLHIFQRGRSTGFSTFFNPEESSQMLVHDVSPELTHPRFLPLRKSQWKCTISLFRRFSNRVPLDQQAMSTRVKIQLGQRPIEAKRVAIGKGNECVGWIKQQGGLLWIPAKH